MNESRKFFYFFNDEVNLEYLKGYLRANSITFTESLPNSIEFEISYSSNVKSKLIKEFGGKLIETDSIIDSIITYLSFHNKKITFAESCTGGALANRFISRPGASQIIDGSFITYSNEIKSAWLYVRDETLQRFGAVSKECVREMAIGAKKKLKADISIAVSGIAGPTGAIKDKPVGTVFISVLNKDRLFIKRVQLKGGRVEIQRKSVDWAIYLLILSEENFFDFFSKNS